MALVRQELGPEAIILATQESAAGTAVTAAVEPFSATPPGAAEPEPPPDPAEVINEALHGHGVPQRLAGKLLTAALEFPEQPPLLALTGALDALYGFRPLLEQPPQPLIFVGAPGAGKTVSVAKLAARAVLLGQTVRVVSTDTVRAGGIEQLEAFTRLLGLPLHRADDEQELADCLAAAPVDELVLIDSPGTNPYNPNDRTELAGFLAAARAEPVFVLGAGGDLYDTVEMADAFVELGCRRLLATRLDMVHRLGSLLAAAELAGLAFSDAGIAASIADGLVALNPLKLARLVLPDPPAPERPLT
jgi:flagellar biosynthesis protein FlhF